MAEAFSLLAAALGVSAAVEAAKEVDCTALTPQLTAGGSSSLSSRSMSALDGFLAFGGGPILGVLTPLADETGCGLGVSESVSIC